MCRKPKCPEHKFSLTSANQRSRNLTAPPVSDSSRTKWAEAKTTKNVCHIVLADSNKRWVNYIIRKRKSGEIVYMNTLKLQKKLERWFKH